MPSLWYPQQNSKLYSSLQFSQLLLGGKDCKISRAAYRKIAYTPLANIFRVAWPGPLLLSIRMLIASAVPSGEGFFWRQA